MESWLIGGIMATGGIAVIVYRKQLIAYFIDYQNKHLGYQFGKKTVDFYTMFSIPLGIFLIVVGVLLALGLGDDLGISAG